MLLISHSFVILFLFSQFLRVILNISQLSHAIIPKYFIDALLSDFIVPADLDVGVKALLLSAVFLLVSI